MADDAVARILQPAVVAAQRHAVPGVALGAELLALQGRAGVSESAWNIDDMLEIIDRVISCDEEVLDKVENQNLEKAETTLKEMQDRLALAETNNGYIEKCIRCKS